MYEMNLNSGLRQFRNSGIADQSKAQVGNRMALRQSPQ
jgi:hypothetical protein